jgi:hypothetical protein
MNDFVYMICIGYAFGISVIEAAHGLSKIIDDSGDLMNMPKGGANDDHSRIDYEEDLY